MENKNIKKLSKILKKMDKLANKMKILQKESEDILKEMGYSINKEEKDIEIGKTYSGDELENMGYEFELELPEVDLDIRELIIVKYNPKSTRQYKVLDVGNDNYKILKEIN